MNIIIIISIVWACKWYCDALKSLWTSWFNKN